MIYPCFVATLEKTDGPCTINACKEQNISPTGFQAAKRILGNILSKFIGLIYCREDEEFPAGFICRARRKGR
jgi:hypothetical protein